MLCWLPLCHGHRKLLQCSYEVAYERTFLFFAHDLLKCDSFFFFVSFTEQNPNHDSMKSGGMNTEET